MAVASDDMHDGTEPEIWEFAVSRSDDGEWLAVHKATGHRIESPDVGALKLAAAAYRIASSLRLA